MLIYPTGCFKKERRTRTYIRNLTHLADDSKKHLSLLGSQGKATGLLIGRHLGDDAVG
jgi:hypothetical protein